MILIVFSWISCRRKVLFLVKANKWMNQRRMGMEKFCKHLTDDAITVLLDNKSL